jgi:hypothetical protein
MNIHEPTCGLKTIQDEEINTIITKYNKFIIGIGVFSIIQFSILFAVL